MIQPSESHSIRRFENDFQKALQRREHLLTESRFSVVSGTGELAIIMSLRPDHRLIPRTIKETGADWDECIAMQQDAVREQAQRIESERGAKHQDIRTYRATGDSFDWVLGKNSRHISDIVLIGHGSINGVWSEDRKRNYGWRDASKAARYLLDGVVEQRSCGHFPLKPGTNVPFGTFVVRHFSNVLAATGKFLPDIDTLDGIFQPIFDDSERIDDQIAKLNREYAHQAVIKDGAPLLKN